MGAQRSLPYVRAIDGVRAVAVILVLAFHGEAPFATGGFLGVSLFFTLSGYLITQLLLREHEETGRVSLRSFWARRLRRLAPASLLCLGAVAIAVAMAPGLFPGTSVRGDIVAALTDVANWRFAFASSSYGDLLTAQPSPVIHFWSLAIEEQFYLVFPIVVAAILAILGRRALAALLVGIGALCTIAALASSENLAYYGSYSRAPELLTGALLAMALPIGRPTGARAARTVAMAGSVAAIGLFALVVRTEVADGWLYRGGLPAVSLLSCAILAATTVPGPVRTLCSWKPLVAVGRCSYGLYVYHWPLFLVLTQARVGFGGPGLFAVRLLVTALVAVVSLVFVEGPIRRRGVHARVPVGRYALAAAFVCVLLVATLTPAVDPRRPSLRFDKLAETLSFSGLRAHLPSRLDVLVLGSVPEVATWLGDVPVAGSRITVHSAVRAGCPLLLPDRDEAGCPSFARAAMSAVAKREPDLIVVGVGAAERSAIMIRAAQFLATPQSGDLRPANELLRMGGALVLSMVRALPDVPTLFVDTAVHAEHDPIRLNLQEASLEHRRMIVRAAHDAASLTPDVQRLADTSGPIRRRVLVIGDSTSYQLAHALDAAARDRLEVVWAGQQNCGIVAVSRIRWWRGAEFDQTDCPSPVAVWPRVVAKLRPDVVLAVASLPELSEQRYPGQDRWVEPGEPDYTAAHDVGMSDLQSLLRTSGAVTLVATTPPVGTPGHLEGNFTSSVRLLAWLSQIHRWDRQWRSVGVLDWGAMVTDAERSVGRSLRPDGIHLDPDELATYIGTRLARDLITTTRSVQAEARAAGCRIGADRSARLVLTRCRQAAGGSP